MSRDAHYNFMSRSTISMQYQTSRASKGSGLVWFLPMHLFACNPHGLLSSADRRPLFMFGYILFDWYAFVLSAFIPLLYAFMYKRWCFIHVRDFSLILAKQ